LLLFKHPSNIFKLLTGEAADLIVWNFPKLELNFDWEKSFFPAPPLPIAVRVGLSFNAFADLGLGFNTRGLKTGNFFDGFYFTDVKPVNGQLVDVPEFGASLEVTLGIGVDLVIASVGIEGGVGGEVDANLNDINGDGRLYFDELAKIFTKLGPEFIFDI